MTSDPSNLGTRAAALADAVRVGGAELDPEAQASAAALARRVGERMALAGRHTVVALGGATGSGKSSLFNALVGAPVAEVGARRPITSTPHAAVWGPDPATGLLDWLGVHRRHRVVDGGARDTGTLDGLVLLDLPDVDSRVLEHRAEAARVLELVDLFVWVTDPQKYADAVLHDGFVAARANHEDVTLAVLNHADSLSQAGLSQCRDDLVRLLHADGLSDPTVLVTSARTGQGVTELRERIQAAVSAHTATVQRLGADLTDAVELVERGVAATEPDVGAPVGARLVDALSKAAGVPVVLKAVEEDYIRESAGHTGWVFTRWSKVFSPEPLKRLRLDRVETRDGIPVGEADIRAVLGRSSIPPPTPAARAEVELALGRLADEAAGGLPRRWAQAVHDAAQPRSADLQDALDRAIVGTPLRARAPLWWRVVDVLQWVFALAVLAGLLWYVGIVVAQWLKFLVPDPPRWGPVPYPFLLLATGLVGGLLLTSLARVFARIGARRRRALIGQRLSEAIGGVSTSRVIEPVAAVLARHRAVREHLAAARR